MLMFDSSPSGRRNASSSSPEFEFWLPANNGSCSSVPETKLVSADELFANGVLLPLHLLPLHNLKAEPDTTQDAITTTGQENYTNPPIQAELEPESALAEPEAGAAITAPAPASFSSSKRWRDIFKVGDKKGDEKDREKEKEKEKRKEKNKPSGSCSGAGTELNINIWPFARSRSAGDCAGSGAPRPKPARKASSAPCSRSNSRGESSKAQGGGAGRRWAASPGRAGLTGGVHVGRSSPVWQIKRAAGKRAELPTPRLPMPPPGGPHKDRVGNNTTSTPATTEKSIGTAKKSNGGVRGLNLSVNSCIGYKHQVSCRRADIDAFVGAGDGGGRTQQQQQHGEGGAGGGLFSIRSLFSSKKVH